MVVRWNPSVSPESGTFESEMHIPDEMLGGSILGKVEII